MSDFLIRPDKCISDVTVNTFTFEWHGKTFAPKALYFFLKAHLPVSQKLDSDNAYVLVRLHPSHTYFTKSIPVLTVMLIYMHVTFLLYICLSSICFFSEWHVMKGWRVIILNGEYTFYDLRMFLSQKWMVVVS